jgi:hypothetical protein
MRHQSALLSGVALGVLLSIGFGASADAKATRHHKGHAAGGGSALEQKVESLTAAVSELENRLNDEAQARQALQAQAQAAQADAAAARADAADAHRQLAEQIQTIPGSVQGQIDTAIRANKPKPSWAENTTVSGTMFADITNIGQTPRPATGSNGVVNNVTNKNENGFNYDIKRFYISIDHKFNDVFSANVTTDFTYDNATITIPAVPAKTITIPATGATGSTGIACTPVAPAKTCSITIPGVAAQTFVTGDKTGQLYLKKAYLQAKLSDALIFRVGSADLPWVPFVEGIYGYRYVENVLIDRTKFGTSADWGVHVLGALPASPKLTVNYQISAVNGLGYKQPAMGTFNRSTTMDVEGRLSATYDKRATLAIGGYVGKLGNAIQGVSTPNTATRFDALAAYVDPRFRVGVEYFYANAWNDVTKAKSAANRSEGVSVFGSYNFTPQISVFGRYDWERPTETTAGKVHDDYFNIGASYEPTKIVDFALVYKRDSVANGLLSTSNGAIGNVLGKTGTYDEVGIWTQVKW